MTGWLRVYTQYRHESCTMLRHFLVSAAGLYSVGDCRSGSREKSTDEKGKKSLPFACKKDGEFFLASCFCFSLPSNGKTIPGQQTAEMQMSLSFWLPVESETINLKALKGRYFIKISFKGSFIIIWATFVPLFILASCVFP